MLDEPDRPDFPPLLRGEVSEGNPFRAAVGRARAGADPGLVLWSHPSNAVCAALVLAPEDPLERAAGVLLAAPLALGDALAMLAPPDTAVQYRWPGDVLVNGGRCACCRAAAGTADPLVVPDWLVVGVEVALSLPADAEGGERPDETCLLAEGFGALRPEALIEGWARHMVLWINRWTGDGMAPLLAAWRARADGLGEALPGGGVFAGLDRNGGMLVQGAAGTTLRPLAETLERW